MLRLEPTHTRPRRLLLTPLIDAIFILVIFFMLASRFSSLGELPLTISAQGSTGTQPFMLLSISGADLRLNGRLTSIEQMPNEVKSLIASQNAELLLQLEDQTPVQRLVDVVQALRPLEGLKYSINTSVSPSVRP